MKVLISFAVAATICMTEAESLVESPHKESRMEAEVAKAYAVYQEALSAAEANYRRKFAEAIMTAAHVEVYLLDSTMIKAKEADIYGAWANWLPKDQFPIVPYGSYSMILKRKKLSVEEIKLLLPCLRETISVEENSGGAFCHYPIHGIRIWDGERIAFQTSICYKCMNFYFEKSTGDADWVSLSSAEFAKVMHQLMPIPQIEKNSPEIKGGEQQAK